MVNSQFKQRNGLTPSVDHCGTIYFFLSTTVRCLGGATQTDSSLTESKSALSGAASM
ncbi:hypothetical protein BDI4_100062 [Burkholderia diffusa]|nr:hypothetical protein BDI4_100062 [Burkholderia diffusa]